MQKLKNVNLHFFIMLLAYQQLNLLLFKKKKKKKRKTSMSFCLLNFIYQDPLIYSWYSFL